MRELVTEFIDAILVDWYRSVSRWQPPGHSSPRGCELCRDSPLSTRLRLAEWPHDVTHSLVLDLTTAAHEVGALLDDAGQNVPRELANRWLTSTVDRHAADISDILQQCVEPRLAEYLHSEVEWATTQLELLPSDLED